jgi:hypothetical protein
MKYFCLKGCSFVVFRYEVLINTNNEQFVYEVDPRNFFVYTHWGRTMCNAELTAIRAAGYAVWRKSST